MRYLAISAGDGSFYSVIKDSLEDAISFTRREFEQPETHDSAWIEKCIRNEDNWQGRAFDSESPFQGRMRWDGEQCYFEIIAIVGDGRPTLKDAIEAARGGPAPTPLKGFA